MEKPKPMFEAMADPVIDTVRTTYAQRGEEYADTWANNRWLALKSVLDRHGVALDKVSKAELDRIGAAVLVDVKYARLEGGYKEDSVIDGIAYQALWAGTMKE